MLFAKPCSKLQFFVSVSSRYFVPSHTEDLCSTKKCPFYSECTLDENREAQCACIQRCSLVFDPVCASDGETYPNECVFKITACALNGNLTLLHQGQCSEFLPLLPFIQFSFSLFYVARLMRHSEHQNFIAFSTFLLFSVLFLCVSIFLSNVLIPLVQFCPSICHGRRVA